MPSKTNLALSLAFAAESTASARNLIFAQKADKEGQTHLASLFRALADSQSVSARRYLFFLRGKVGSTEANLNLTFDQAIPANLDAYAGYIKDADSEGARPQSRAMAHSRVVRSRYKKLRETAGSPDSAPEYHICQICGYVSLDEPPDRCPVCSAVSEKFKKPAVD